MSTTDRFTGQVKWFNNKTGYGFVTLCDGEHKDKDIFTHYSAIRVSDSQYKYLVQGEYVELGLAKPESGPHEFQAVDICGVKGGPIMCETRQQRQPSTDKRPRQQRKKKDSHSETEVPVTDA
jgi:cold shock CspA family protein